MKSSQGPNMKFVELILGPTLYTPKKKCQNDHGVWGPQKTHFMAYIIHWHGPTGFVVGEANEVL